MKFLILIFSLVFMVSVDASVTNPSKSLRGAKYDANEVLQGSFAIDSPTVTYVGTLVGGTSKDPFSGKSNAYAESKLVRVIFPTIGGHVKFGSSSISAAATSSDYFIAPGEEAFFAVNDTRPYMRIVASASIVYYVTEIY